MAALAELPTDASLSANRTQRDFPADATLHGLFERQVHLHGSRVAVICHHDTTWSTPTLSFAALNTKANQLARRLRDHGVGPGSIVAVLVERSFAMTIALWGILKAGAAYLPISPDNPAERINYILADAKVSVVLVHTATAGRAPADVTVLNLEARELYAGDAENPGLTSQPDDLAYVIYTSGSTGRPKGVMIEHRAVVNRLHWMQHAYPLTARDVLLQKTPYSFDVSVWELFWWALEGATLSMLRPGGERSPLVLLEAVQRDRVSILHFVPSMLNVFLEYLSDHPQKVASHLGSLRHVFASGEALSPAHVQKFHEVIGRVTGCRLTNLYGPTEATVDATCFDCPAEAEAPLSRIPIGRPIQNMRAYILSEGKPVAPGETGELCLAGVGLARGYLNNPALTREKFTTHPTQPDERIYHTGDLARWLPDGNIEYLGRADHQVKIRGLRIELEEIENTLRRCPGISDCVVVARQYSESITLIIAYYVASAAVIVAELKRQLQAQLPDYMIPDRFERLDAIPLTSSGKADRKALPDPLARPKPEVKP